MARQLRGYQADAVNDTEARHADGDLALAGVAATGLGKSTMLGQVVVNALERNPGGRALVLAHRTELCDQLTETIQELAPDLRVGRIQGQRNRLDLPVTVAMTNTLGRYSKAHDRLPRLDAWLAAGAPPVMVGYDEFHHAGAPSNRRILDGLRCAGSEATVPMLGVTATLTRADRYGLGDLALDPVAFSYDTLFGIANGHLVMPHGKVVVADHLDLKAAKVTAGDYQDGQLGEMIAQDAAQIVQAWLDHADNRVTAGFFPTVESAREIHAAFIARGVAAEIVTGETKTGDGTFARGSAERGTGIYGRLARGETRVLVGVMVTTEGWDCLDESTEILTANGWRGIGQMATGDVVQSLNRDTGYLEAVPVTRYVERPMNPGERMFTARSQHVDIRTSEGHQFHVRSRWSTKLETLTGAELADRRAPYGLPLSAKSTDDFPGVPLTDDELRFVAWFLTDGGFSGTTKVQISQAKHHKDDIRALLIRLGLDFRERVRTSGPGAYPNARPLHEFTVPKGSHGGSLKRNGWAPLARYLDKNVAEALHEMTRRQFDLFWAELLKGDGDRSWLTCDRMSQVDAYQRMAVERGLSTSYRERTAASGRPWFRVAVRDRRWLMSEPADDRSARLGLEEPRAGERVWCVTNRNSTLVTRRGGKVAIIGNCPPVSCILMGRPTRLKHLYQQIVGRGLRPVSAAMVKARGWVAKTDCLILDVVGASRGQKLVSLIELVPTADVDLSALDSVPCEECHRVRCICAVSEVQRDPDGGRRKLQGPAFYEDFDLLLDANDRWLATEEGHPVLYAEALGRFAVILEEAPGRYRVGSVTKRGKPDPQRIAAGLTLDQARRAAEEWAIGQAPRLGHVNALWRTRTGYPPSGKAIWKARRLGIVDPDSYSAKELADRIAITEASGRMDILGAGAARRRQEAG